MQKKIIDSVDNTNIQTITAFKADCITVVMFLLFFIGVVIGLFIKKDVKFSEQENRYLAERPELSLSALSSGRYGKEYETYLSDQFPFRNQWITLRTITELLLQKKEVNGVYFAEDDYLIELKDSENYESEQAAKNIEYLEEFVRNNSEGMDNSFSILLVPDKSAVLRNKLPASAETADEWKIIKEIYDRCESADCVDVYEELEKHKEEYIYYRTDHHWTSLGSYYGYKAWCNETGIRENKQEEFIKTTVTETFRGTLDSKVNLSLRSDSIDIYEPAETVGYTLVYDYGALTEHTLFDMKKLASKDKYGVFLGGNHSLVEIHTTVKNGKSILLIKDSFANSFIPYLINQFENIYVLDLRYYNQSLSEYMEKRKITDILVLYSLAGFVQDDNIYKLKN